jgi:nitrite reductase/ring-hydroxylating ferredoxin subunit
VRRAGILHALTNGTAVGLMTASWAARRSGRTGRGKLLSLAGMSLLGAGGWLGGHLSYAQGVGVDTTAFDSGPEEWTTVDVDSLEEGKPVCARVGTVPVMLVRVQGEIKALHNRCTHRAGSLADGEVEGNSIVCPLHGSVFNLDDGSVERGPAAYPQPVFEARETGDGIEVRRVAR